MIKIQISTLQIDLEIEMKKTDRLFQLIVIASKSEYLNESGRAWHAEVDENDVKEIEDLLLECYYEPTKPKMITILDGMRVKCAYSKDGSRVEFLVKEFESGTKEETVMKKLFGLCNRAINDSILKRYCSELEKYTGRITS